MPFSPAAPRKLVHTRIITCKGYQRADGQWDVDGRMTDERPQPAESRERAHIRLTVNQELIVTDCAAARTPETVRQLAGLSLTSGFSKRVKELFGGITGGAYVMSLIGPMATTALQTMAKDRIRRLSAQRAGNQVPPILDTCHSWARTSPVVKRVFPEFYVAPPDAG